MSRTAFQDSTDGSIHSNSAPVLRGGDVVDHGSKTLAIVALVAACFALGAVTMYMVLAPEIIDSKISAGTAKAEAVAHTAETHARVALDKVETAEVELGKKGINIRTDGH